MSGISTVLLNHILLSFSVNSLRTFVRAQLELQEERHLDNRHPQRPTTPIQSPFVSPVNSPQATPHTRRRAAICERNPPESPRWRCVPQAQQAQQRHIPPPRNIICAHFQNLFAKSYS